MAIHTNLSIIILNENWLNAIKRHVVTEWIKKDTSICYQQENLFRHKDIHTEIEGLGKDIPWKQKLKKNSWSSNIYMRQNGVKTKTVGRDK